MANADNRKSVFQLAAQFEAAQITGTAGGAKPQPPGRPAKPLALRARASTASSASSPITKAMPQNRSNGNIAQRIPPPVMKRPLSITQQTPQVVLTPPTQAPVLSLVVQELIQTEQSYLQDMQTLDRLYAKPMLDLNLITAHDQKLIFSNLPEIIRFSSEFLSLLQTNTHAIGA